MRRAVCRATAVVLTVSTGLLFVTGTTNGASNLVLGSPKFAGTGAEGWGTVRPAKLYNGGDPSGLLKEIQWTSWGGRSAIGYGLGWIFKPHGGYYSRPVLVELRAQAVGHCGSQPAYTQLAIRWPSKPEAPLGSWHLWSEAKSLCAF